ncbi:ATP-dependent DNA helicase RecG [Hydrogenophaga sp. T4]|nr:ATP-dependent DNA helicase RecG [Hydrogenophaga sp. T4]
MSDAPPAPRKELSAPQKALHKLGLTRDIDLALHLPLRYEDETRVVRLTDARDGQTVQVEGTVTHQEITLRPRRQLLVTLDDGSDTCTCVSSASTPRTRRRWRWARGCGCAARSVAVSWDAPWCTRLFTPPGVNCPTR